MDIKVDSVANLGSILPESYYAATTTLQRCHCASVARNQLLYQLNRLRELLNLTIERYYG